MSWVMTKTVSLICSKLVGKSFELHDNRLKAKSGLDFVRLTATGREEAKKTLTDALNPNVPDDWNPDKKPMRNAGSKKKA